MKSGIVEFRPYRPDDSESIERIIADTWGSQEKEPTNADIVYSSVYIAYCLMISTYAETALIDGSPVGVVMARDLSVRKHFVLKLVLFLLRNFWRVLRPSGIMALIALYRIEIANPRELLRGCPEYAGELTLLITSPEARGHGIGKRLYADAVRYLNGAGAGRFFLYTDTECGYGFYDRAGLVRRKEQKMVYRIVSGVAEMTAFIYDSVKD